MRSRIFALIILFLFLGIPLILYWYFFHQNTSVLMIQTREVGLEFSFRLEGKLQNDNLPIADKAFTFDRHCVGSCMITLPPLEYDLSLSASGREDIHDTLALRVGEKQLYSPQFRQKFVFTLIAPMQKNDALESGLIQNANASFGGMYRSIGTTSGGRYFALRTSENRKNDIGIISVDSFIPLFSLPYTPQAINMDLSRQYIILDRGTADRSILSLDGQQSIIFPYDENILLADTTMGWKVRTRSGVYLYENGIWQKHIEFSDIIDINREFQLAYIDAHDPDNLSKGKYPRGTSVLLLIDKKTGKREILKSGLDIQGLFLYEKKAGFIDRDGNIGILHLNDIIR